MKWTEVRRLPLDKTKKYAVQLSPDSQMPEAILVIEFNEKIEEWETCCECGDFELNDVARYYELPDLEDKI